MGAWNAWHESNAWHWDGAKILPFDGGVPLSDRGFRYGQHVFESIAIRQGVTLLAKEHLEILKISAKQLGIPCSRTLLASLRSFLASESFPDGMLRLYVTAGPGAPGSPVKKPSCYLAWSEAEFPTPAEMKKGMTLTLLKKSFPGEGWGVKSGNYAAHLEAFQLAWDAGADEGIVCNEQGRIISCAMGNLLLWLPDKKKQTTLCTPSPTLGARSGAVLNWVQRQTAVEERVLKSFDLRRAVALAVTNSRLGVMPVRMLDGKNLSYPDLSLTLAYDYLQAHDLS